MSQDRAATTEDAVFQWHPVYRGRTVEEVTRELQADIERDQRAYELALMGAEDAEHDALNSVVDLERRWSTYDFGWHESPPDALAQRIAAFEWEREQRQEMMSWSDYRALGGAAPAAGRPAGDWRASMTDEQRRRTASIGAAVIIGVLVLSIILVIVVVF